MSFDFSKHWKVGEFVIEATPQKNQQLRFKPLRLTLRGRWLTSIMPDSGAGYKQLPEVIPGVCLALDVKRAKLRVVDPLGFPECAEIVAQSNRVRKGWEPEQGPWPEAVHDKLGQGDLKTMLLHMVELVDTGHATVLQGPVPKIEEVLEMPGKARRRYHVTADNEDPFLTEEEAARLRGVKPENVY